MAPGKDLLHQPAAAAIDPGNEPRYGNEENLMTVVDEKVFKKTKYLVRLFQQALFIYTLSNFYDKVVTYKH
jgi:hypothetical protein